MIDTAAVGIGLRQVACCRRRSAPCGSPAGINASGFLLLGARLQFIQGPAPGLSAPDPRGRLLSTVCNRWQDPGIDREGRYRWDFPRLLRPAIPRNSPACVLCQQTARADQVGDWQVIALVLIDYVEISDRRADLPLTGSPEMRNAQTSSSNRAVGGSEKSRRVAIGILAEDAGMSVDAIAIPQNVRMCSLLRQIISVEPKPERATMA